MKNYYIYISLTCIFVCQLVFTGCEEFLEPEPKSFINPASFFKNEKDAEASVYAGYRTFGSGIVASNGWYRDFYLPAMSDDFYARRAGEWINDIGRDSRFEDFTSVRGPHGFFYRMGVINTFSWAVDGISGMPDFARKNELIAEAKFLRAYSYFTMVQLFGGLPVIEKSLETADEASNIPRGTANEVYDLIIRDLTAGTVDLPETPAALGRPTKYTAMAYLAKVLLTRGEWAEAASWAKKVINESDRVLLPSIWDVFDSDNENNAESLFEVQMTVETQRANQVGNWPRGIGINGDKDWFKGPNWGGLYLATDDLIATFEPGDERRKMIATQVVNAANEELTFYAEDQTPNYSIKRMAKSYIENIESNNNSGYNFISMRLGEVYLIAAEAENEANGPGGALQYINPIRNRANLPNLEDSNPAAASDQDAFRTAVRNERRVELFDERIRYFDLLRWGILLERVKAVTPTAQIQPHHVLWPIPQDVFERNEGMTEQQDQNPGY